MAPEDVTNELKETQNQSLPLDTVLNHFYSHQIPSNPLSLSKKIVSLSKKIKSDLSLCFF
jgi:hypothetical protein